MGKPRAQTSVNHRRSVAFAGHGKRGSLFLCTLLLLCSLGQGTSRATSVTPIKRSSAAIAITADGSLLLAVNPDSNSLSLIDTATETTLAELPVGIDPRTVAVDDAAARAYVANRGSDDLTVLNLVTQTVITTVALGNRPYGAVVSPDGSTVYVSEQGADRISAIDTATLQPSARYQLGDRPSGLAISDDGRTLVVTHLLEGDVTFIDLDQGARHLLYLPVLVRGSLSGGQWRVARSGPASSSSGVEALQSEAVVGLWPDSNLVQSVVLGPDGRTAYVPHTRSNTENRALTFDTTVFPIVSLVDIQQREHLLGQQLTLETIDPPGIGLPFDAAITPDGQEIWVLNAASNDITVVDLSLGQRVAHIEVGDNPRGIVISPDGQKAYVNNTLSGTVSVVDRASYTVSGGIAVTDIPLPPLLLRGKLLFHSSDDPRMARDQWISCNTCHFEGEHDGRTWVFGFSGPRNTTGLLGMIETYPLRWSGEWDESADSEFANRRENFGAGLIEGDMHCDLSPPDCVNRPPNQGRSDDLDALAAFIDSLQLPPSPAHASGEPLTPAERRGQAIFDRPELRCAECHPGPLYTDLLTHDVGTATADERIGPAYDTPTLRGLYDSAPYFHDGSAPTLYDSLTRPSPGSEHDVRAFLSEMEIRDLVAYLEALPFE